MRTLPAMLLASIALLSSACGAQVNLFGHTVSEGKSRQPAAGEEQASGQGAAANAANGNADSAAQAHPLVRDVLLSLNASVRQQASTDRRFDDEALHAAIAAELRQRGLMGGPDSTEGTPVDILIDGYSLQATGNAAVAGHVAHAGKLSGLVRVLDADGREQRSFKVRADAIVQIPAQGSDAAALNELYGRFAAMTADGLAPKTPATKK